MSDSRESTEDAIVKDARHIQRKHKKYAAQFKAADAKRPKKLLPPEYLAAFAKSVTAVAQGVKKTAAAGGVISAETQRETSTRAALHAELARIRDEIKIAWPDDGALQKLFGVGRRLDPASTPVVLAQADRILGVFREEDQDEDEDDDGEDELDDETRAAMRAQAIQAGVTAARVTAIGKLRKKLGATDDAQKEAQTGRKGTVMRKGGDLAVVTKGIARIRSVAKVVFRDKKDVLAEFGTTRQKVPAARKKPRKKPE